eukprot:scaffold1230_cov97-Skeletonema_dohrnii-CCMP3373.AAC.2
MQRQKHITHKAIHMTHKLSDTILCGRKCYEVPFFLPFFAFALPASPWVYRQIAKSFHPKRSKFKIGRHETKYHDVVTLLVAPCSKLQTQLTAANSAA